MRITINFSSLDIWKNLAIGFDVYSTFLFLMMVSWAIQGAIAIALIGSLAIVGISLVLQQLRKRFDVPSGGSPALRLSTWSMRRIGSRQRIKWVDVTRVVWPIAKDQPIRLSQIEQDSAIDPTAFKIEPKKIHPDHRAKLYQAIRQQTSGRPQVNWEQFCLNRAILELDLLSDEPSLQERSAFSLLPSLKHYVIKQTKKKRASKSLDERLSKSGLLIWPVLIMTLEAEIYFLLAGTIIASAIVNSWIITGGWCAPVINVCGVFSGVLAVLGFLSFQFGERKKVAEGELRFTWGKVWFFAYLFAAPTLFYCCLYLGQYGKPIVYLLFLGWFLPVVTAAIAVNSQRAQLQERLGKAAVRFWDYYHAYSGLHGMPQ